MGDKSAIEWTNATWNVMTGCTRVSPGCDHCYMFAQYPRLHGMKVKGYELAPDVVQLIPDRLGQPARWKRPRRIFVNSMADLFHKAATFDFVSSVFQVMAREAPQHTYQVLTKRPGWAVAWWNQRGRHEFHEWPANVWLGTSVENEKYAPRLTVLARVPAPIRFVSVEPLLGPVDLDPWLFTGDLQWVIVGGESGPGARPMDTNWAQVLQMRCHEAEVPFFLKQLGGFPDRRGGDKAVLNGVRYTEFPIWDRQQNLQLPDAPPEG